MHQRTITRFYCKVRPAARLRAQRLDACWTWRGALNRRGHGRFTLDGVTYLAHEFAWRLRFGKPYGTVQHLCRREHCVNWRHLFDDGVIGGYG